MDFPANTNILYVDLASAELVGSSENERSLPGMVLNTKKPIVYMDNFGDTHRYIICWTTFGWIFFLYIFRRICVVFLVSFIQNVCPQDFGFPCQCNLKHVSSIIWCDFDYHGKIENILNTLNLNELSNPNLFWWFFLI